MSSLNTDSGKKLHVMLQYFIQFCICALTCVEVSLSLSDSLLSLVLWINCCDQHWETVWMFYKQSNSLNKHVHVNISFHTSDSLFWPTQVTNCWSFIQTCINSDLMKRQRSCLIYTLKMNVVVGVYERSEFNSFPDSKPRRGSDKGSFCSLHEEPFVTVCCFCPSAWMDVYTNMT